MSFYVIPKDPELRKKWLHKISHKIVNPTTGHRVCSVHFEGGKKTYTNSVPTIVPKTIKLTTFKDKGCTKIDLLNILRYSGFHKLKIKFCERR